MSFVPFNPNTKSEQEQEKYVFYIITSRTKRETCLLNQGLPFGENALFWPKEIRAISALSISRL